MAAIQEVLYYKSSKTKEMPTHGNNKSGESMKYLYVYDVYGRYDE